jgi:zinc protease
VGPVTREVTLDNGLKVILKAVQTAPVISTWMWYRVGSRDEVEGSTGLSHWVEHMLFKGSARFPKGSIMRNVQRYGGYSNAMTSHDFTAYYETLPSNQAELALDIESDRMTTALFDPEEVARERTVIISEREGAENEPYYVLTEEMAAAAFRIHPYHHQTIGWQADLLSITRDQLYNHYRQYYVPNNAVLVAVGNLDMDAYLRLVEQYFGHIPAGELPPSRVRQEPPPRGERRVTLRMPGFAPMVRLSFHAPQVSHADYIPLVVAEALLSGGQAMFSFGGGQSRSARLYRAMVETELASSVGSSYYPSIDPYLFSVGATVREGRTPDEVEAALSAEIERLQREPVEPAELAVAIRQTQAQFAYNSESATDQALTLGFLEMMDSHTRMDRLLDELAQVTPEDVARVAQTYLQQDNCVVGRFMPTGEGAESMRPWRRQSTRHGPACLRGGFLFLAAVGRYHQPRHRCENATGQPGRGVGQREPGQRFGVCRGQLEGGRDPRQPRNRRVGQHDRQHAHARHQTPHLPGDQPYPGQCRGVAGFRLGPP